MKLCGIFVILVGIAFTSVSSQTFSNPAWDMIQKTREKMQHRQGFSDAHREFKEEFFTSAISQGVIPEYLKAFVQLDPHQRETVFRQVAAGNISAECTEVIEAGLIQLGKIQDKEPDVWVLQMFDAWGKPPAGILSGNTQASGDFQECLQIRGKVNVTSRQNVSEFKGLYCSAYLTPLLNETASKSRNIGTKTSLSPGELIQLMARNDKIPLVPFLGSCFPSVCKEAEINALLESAVSFFTQNSLGVTFLGCRTEDKPAFGAGEITIVIVLAIIAGLCVAGTLVDIFIIRKQSPAAGRLSFPLKFFKAFSTYDNTEKVLSTTAGKENLGCLHGLRFFSMAWVVAGHTWFQVRLQFSWNGVDAKQMDRIGWTMTTMLNPTIAVDTFFAMSGLLVSYNLLRELDKTKTFKQFATFKVPMMYLHRYIRLTPTYAILLGILATLLPYFSTSPTWYIMESEAKNCQRYWWHNLLYFNNLLDYRNYEGDMCYQESWYLADDMQFFLISPLIIYPLWKNSKIGLAILGGLSFLHLLGNFLIIGINHITPSFLPFSPDPEYGVLFYWKPWTRIGPYLVGIFVGYLLYLAKKADKTSFTLPRWAVWLGWTVNTGVALAIVFGIDEYVNPDNFCEAQHSTGALIYGSVHRYIWGMVIGWVIYACVTDNGGIVNRILSWNVFMPLGRLTYCVYISSFHIQLLYHITLLHPVHFSNYIMMHTFFAHLVFTCIIGFILTITIESPFINLQKLIF